MAEVYRINSLVVIRITISLISAHEKNKALNFRICLINELEFHQLKTCILITSHRTLYFEKWYGFPYTNPHRTNFFIQL